MPRGSDQQHLTSLIILKKNHCSSKDNGLWEEDCYSSCGKTIVPWARRCVIRNTRDGGLSSSCHELLASLQLMIIKLSSCCHNVEPVELTSVVLVCHHIGRTGDTGGAEWGELQGDCEMGLQSALLWCSTTTVQIGRVHCHPCNPAAGVRRHFQEGPTHGRLFQQATAYWVSFSR
jgi:hypothetical protein